MWQWIVEHSELLSALGTVLMAVIWAVYLQIMVIELRQQRQPRILLENVAGGLRQPTAMVVNLSSVSMQIEAVIVHVETAEGTYVHTVTDFERLAPEPLSNDGTRPPIHPGPIRPGRYLVLGTFDGLLRETLPDSKDLLRTATRLPMEMRVVAVHGGTRRPVAACRRFQVCITEHGGQIEPASFQTRTLYGFRSRRTVSQWLQQAMEAEAEQNRWRVNVPTDKT